MVAEPRPAPLPAATWLLVAAGAAVALLVTRVAPAARHLAIGAFGLGFLYYGLRLHTPFAGAPVDPVPWILGTAAVVVLLAL